MVSALCNQRLWEPRQLIKHVSRQTLLMWTLLDTLKEKSSILSNNTKIVQASKRHSKTSVRASHIPFGHWRRKHHLLFECGSLPSDFLLGVFFQEEEVKVRRVVVAMSCSSWHVLQATNYMLFHMEAAEVQWIILCHLSTAVKVSNMNPAAAAASLAAARHQVW